MHFFVIKHYYKEYGSLDIKTKASNITFAATMRYPIIKHEVHDIRDIKQNFRSLAAREIGLSERRQP